MVQSDASKQLVDVFDRLSHFSAATEYILKRNTASIHSWSYDEDMVEIYHDLLRSPPDTKAITTTNTCRYGALTFLSMITRNPAARPPNMVRHLKRLLIGLPRRSLEAPLLLWLLFIGGASALGLPDRDWFAEQLKPLTTRDEFQHSTWESTRMILQDTLWNEAILESPCKQLWDDLCLPDSDV